MASSGASQPWSSREFESMSRRITECLRRNEVNLVGVHGWDGVGRQRVMRHAVEALQKTRDKNPYTRILWLSKAEGLGFLIANRIHEALLAERDDTGEPFRFWWEPLLLPGYKMLVVVDDLQHPFSLSQVSIGRYPNAIWPLTILFSSGDLDLLKSLESSPQNWTLRPDTTDATYLREPFDDLSTEAALDLLWHESDSAADQLPRQHGMQVFPGDAILECFLYCSLFPGKFYAPTYWLAEGLLHSVEGLTVTECCDLCDLLITNLRERNMLEKLPPGETDARRVQIATTLDNKVCAIATTTIPHPPPTSRSKKGVRFVIEIYKNLKEAPSMERWDQEGITRVSFSSNEIELLRLSPHYLNNSGRHPGGENISPGLRAPKCNNLSTLILSFNPMSLKIEDDFFEWVPNLCVLNLSHTGLVELPPSLTCLRNLRCLILNTCTRLQTISPCIERGFHNLEILDLMSCPLSQMKTASFQQVRNLRALYLDDTSFQNLQVLDLSNTRIEEFPNVSNITSLVRLNLLNTQHLLEVYWTKLARQPVVINWDQCGSGSPLFDTPGLHISVKDAEIFRGLRYGSRLWGQAFREFHISLSTCTKEQMGRPTHTQLNRLMFPYTDIIPHIRKCHHHQFSPPRTTYSSSRHLHILGGTSPFTERMMGVLPHVASLVVSDHTSVRNLPVSYPMELTQCLLENCRSMETIFLSKPTPGYDPTLPYLDDIYVFHMTRLRTVYEGGFAPGSFARLRRVHVDCCPSMVTIFSSPHIVLEQLRVLVIRLCGNLGQIFGEGTIGHKVAPALSELYLWDLQELGNICEGHLPSLRMLKLRGCPKLRKLPVPPVDNQGNPLKLEITAENKWWENLKEENKEHIIFKGWSPWTLSAETRS